MSGAGARSTRSVSQRQNSSPPATLILRCGLEPSTGSRCPRMPTSPPCAPTWTSTSPACVYRTTSTCRSAGTCCSPTSTSSWRSRWPTPSPSAMSCSRQRGKRGLSWGSRTRCCACLPCGVPRNCSTPGSMDPRCFCASASAGIPRSAGGGTTPGPPGAASWGMPGRTPCTWAASAAGRSSECR